MITKEKIMTDFKCSEQYAQKLMESAGDDQEQLEELYYQKLIERRTRRAIRVVGLSLIHI